LPSPLVQTNMRATMVAETRSKTKNRMNPGRTRARLLGPDPREVCAAFEDQHRRDKRGWYFHVPFAALACFLAAWPTTFVEIGVAPVAVLTVIRLPWIWRIYIPLFRQPIFWILLAWAAWQSLSLAWSPDVPVGFDEFGTMRFAPLLLVLWPALDARRWLIGAWAAGFLFANASQVYQAIAQETGLLSWDRFPERNSGWWDPAVGGTMLMAALGLHLPAALMGRGRARALGAAGSIVTLLAILATGTRGAWIGAACLCGLTGLFGAGRLRPRRRLARVGAGALLALLAIGAVAWLTIGDRIAQRAEAGWRETERALTVGDYRSDTGARVYMYRVAWWMFADAPVAGHGVGSFRAGMIREAERLGIYDETFPSHDHAHCLPAHVAATTGLIGLAIVGLLFGVSLVGGLRDLPRGIGSYDAAPAFALIGLMLVSAFDTVHVNSQTSAQLYIAVALCVGVRPPLRGRPSTDGAAGDDRDPTGDGGESGASQ
jgi:hypothetical protein